MKTFNQSLKISAILIAFLFSNQFTNAQTKKIKRPKSRVGVSSVDTFVQESFDLYDKVYKYDGYAEAGTPLDDEDIDVLEEALTEVTALSESAPNIISDLDGVGILKQGKATLQVNKSKKAIKYSIKTAKELLLGQRERDKKEDEDISENESDSDNSDSSENENTSNKENEEEPSNYSDNLKINSKFDFVPGDKLLFFDDFSQDFVGDFPSKWNTNGTGETVQISDIGNWFQLKSGYGVIYMPLMEALPEDYTIEFDLLTQGLDNNTSSTSYLNIYISDNNTFKDNTDNLFTGLPLGQFGAFNIRVANRDQANQINTALTADIRKDILNKPHISIAVNKKRFRLWINQKKYIDIPQFVYAPDKLKYLKFNVKGLKDGKDKIFIKNLKIAEGGVDLRRKLMSEGKISTNGILFDSGSDKIQPQSYGIIRQISQVLM